MYKFRNKTFALLTALIFALAFVLPFAGPASASVTSYYALGKPTSLAAGGTGDLAPLYIKIDPMAAGSTAEAIVKLPKDFIIAKPVAITVSSASYGTPDGPTGTIVNQPGVPPGAQGFDATYPFGPNEFKFKIANNNGTNPKTEKVEVTIPLKNVTVPAGFSGDITVEIIGVAGQLDDGKVVVGVVPSAAVEVTADGPDFLNEGNPTANEIVFTIKENKAGALKTGASLKITLPKGFSWNTVTQTAVLDGNFAFGGGNTATITGTNSRTLQLNVNTQSTDASVVKVAATVSIDEFEAKYGDVEVSLSGVSSVNPSSLVVSQYVDFGVEVSVEDATEILAGRVDQPIGEIVIEETAPVSLIQNRTILLTLPKGVEWEDAGNLDNTHVNATASITNDRKTMKIVVGDNRQSTNKSGKIVVEKATVNTAVNFRGDLEVEIDGSAGVSGEVVVAEVVAPITVTAEKPNVKIGVQNQAAGDLVITEAEAETLKRNKDLVISPSLSGVSFNATPKVEVTEGDIEVSLKKTTNSLILTIDAESSKASTIKISGITVTVDRAYPEGEVELKFEGDALDEANDRLVKKARGADVALFPRDTVAATVVNATCVTPAPGEEKQNVTFVIGSTTYTVNGVEQSMDVAPYVKDGRTYLPVRYVGYALGVAEDNIFWDGKTATLMKGDKVVQVTIGSKGMVVNGATINMDVAPEITNGRTMLPFRWIAMAFGAQVDWDQTTQTVTMEL